MGRLDTRIQVIWPEYQFISSAVSYTFQLHRQCKAANSGGTPLQDLSLPAWTNAVTPKIDVEGLTIAVSSSRDTPEDPSKPKPRGKTKGKPDTRELISDAHLRLKAGVHYGLIGRNGTGKSTLLRAMADKLVPGIPHSTRIAILQQTETASEEDVKDFAAEEAENKHKTVLQYVLSSDHSRNEVVQKMNLVDIEQQARQILIGLGFHETTFDKPFLTLSGGWRMRCMLASVLIQSPDFMILDEPTNFLDLLGVVWLENYLRQLKDTSQTTIILVSHDRDFVNAVCEEIIILRDQKLTYFKGNLSAYEKDFEEQKLYWGRMKEAQERQIAHMEATIRETTKTGKKTNDDNKLRMAKSRQKKLDDRMGVQVSATGGRFKLNRDRAGWHSSSREEIEVPTDEKGTSLILPDATELRYPGPLISAEGIVFKYKPNGAPVLDGVDLVMHMGDRVGLMGLNGCGKSTLIRLLVGNALPTKGKISTHSRLKLGYYAQHSIEDLQEQGQTDPNLTALGLMAKETDGTMSEGHLRGLLSSLGLQGRIASDVPVSRLSGGQLVRLALAKVIWNSPHLLVLDEITTHLDFHTVTALASALSSFNGAILLVSHDRFLVRSVIEGKRDEEHQLDDDFEGIDDEMDESQSRRRAVYVLKGGKLKEQNKGVEQFEQSLVKRVQKMLPAQG
ncbi:P-loop containing nucleoside triphosphate hydrolase protein [Aspergillus flavus]|uniref:P-loop containing nucleoside triphosphate hydrolase protein n=2 Tax=Aspergillus subgen. Circumdati TaxID=2720871 RepID=A0A5N6GVS1_ASPFL|nr:ATPase components of ABC transporter [Aspergillus oryzae 3.042]KAB8246065.1 P-loop containing nucleoside triphosphate hydrolase protein [Aspergillus flavus]KDE81609.1 ATPase component of ABC transporter [Aspergillus oryzae 100-8]|eukprot:EIT82988.1 ATPase components of ABC transporter [Aspergillus oryzae 3.042]